MSGHKKENRASVEKVWGDKPRSTYAQDKPVRGIRNASRIAAGVTVDVPMPSWMSQFAAELAAAQPAASKKRGQSIEERYKIVDGVAHLSEQGFHDLLVKSEVFNAVFKKCDRAIITSAFSGLEAEFIPSKHMGGVNLDTAFHIKTTHALKYGIFQLMEGDGCAVIENQTKRYGFLRVTTPPHDKGIYKIPDGAKIVTLGTGHNDNKTYKMLFSEIARDLRTGRSQKVISVNLCTHDSVYPRMVTLGTLVHPSGPAGNYALKQMEDCTVAAFENKVFGSAGNKSPEERLRETFGKYAGIAFCRWWHFDKSPMAVLLRPDFTHCQQELK